MKYLIVTLALLTASTAEAAMFDSSNAYYDKAVRAAVCIGYRNSFTKAVKSAKDITQKQKDSAVELLDGVTNGSELLINFLLLATMKDGAAVDMAVIEPKIADFIDGYSYGSELRADIYLNILDYDGYGRMYSAECDETIILQVKLLKGIRSQ